MNDILIISISKEELFLLEDIDDLGFGELHSISLSPKQVIIGDQDLTDKEFNFINTLRDERSLDIVMIHNGEPVSAQKASITSNGNACVKKFRF